MSSAAVSVIDAENIKLEGSLDSTTAQQLWQDLTNAIEAAASSKLVLSLASVTNIDTAGVALLVNCAVKANKRNISLSLHQPPENLYKLAKLSDVDSILALQ